MDEAAHTIIDQDFHASLYASLLPALSFIMFTSLPCDCEEILALRTVRRVRFLGILCHLSNVDIGLAQIKCWKKILGKKFSSFPQSTDLPTKIKTRLPKPAPPSHLSFTARSIGVGHQICSFIRYGGLCRQFQDAASHHSEPGMNSNSVKCASDEILARIANSARSSTRIKSKAFLRILDNTTAEYICRIRWMGRLWWKARASYSDAGTDGTQLL